MELMTPTSPCSIVYNKEYIHNGYIFEIVLDTGESIRINNKTQIFLNSLGLLSVPIILKGNLNNDFIETLCNILIKTDKKQCEGFIIYLPELYRGFKLKFGLYHESSFWLKFKDKMYEDPIYGKMAKSVKLMLKKTGEYVREKRNSNKSNPVKPIILRVMRKEVGHSDWVKDFKQLEKKDYGAFFNKFTQFIVEKLEELQPELVDTFNKKILLGLSKEIFLI